MGWSLPLARKGGFVRALKGSSVTEEFQRDALDIRKAGGSEGRVLTVGEGVLDQPTFVAEVERLR
jgi:16S rRNA (guanine527-N7)-methyltransferase